MMLEWLMRQIALRNFCVIRSHVVKDNSLSQVCGTVAAAVYAEIDEPDCDRALCLSILQTMLDKRWQWSNTRSDIHRLLPLHCQLEKLCIPGAERNRYYDSVACVSAASNLGSIMTANDFRKLRRHGAVGGGPF